MRKKAIDFSQKESDSLISADSARAHIMAACSRREMSEKQVHEKLCAFASFSQKQVSDIIEQLKKDKYIDNARFATAFTRDKLRFLHWGPDKILRGLKDAGIEDAIAEEAIAAEEELANKVLSEILEKKKVEISKKISRKTEQYKEQAEVLSNRLSNKEDNVSPKERAAIYRKIYALGAKIRSASVQMRAELTAYAVRKGFNIRHISAYLDERLQGMDNNY